MDRSAVFLHVCYAEDKQWWWTMFTYASIMTPLVLMHSVTGWEQSWNNEYCSKWSTVYLFQLIATCVKHGHSAKYHMWNENRGNETAGIHTIPIHTCSHTFTQFQYTHAHTCSHIHRIKRLWLSELWKETYLGPTVGVILRSHCHGHSLRHLMSSKGSSGRVVSTCFLS